MTRPMTLPLLLPLLLPLMGACGGSPEPAAAAPTTGTASAGGEDNSCEAVASQLCDELGRGTEGCAASALVMAWLPEQACDAALANIDYSVGRIVEQRKDCDEFSRRVCDEFGDDSPACARVTQDMAQIPPGTCNTLLERYPELIAQVRKMMELAGPLSTEQQALLVAGNPPSLGATDAAVTIVEFSDFQCPYCSMAAAASHSIHGKYGDRVRIVFRQFPLSFHKDARLAAEASLAAHAQGKFWELHDLMFENQDALSRDDLMGYAKKLGLDMKAFEASLEDSALKASVESDLELGKLVRVSGTPTMFINGARVDNPTDFDALVPTIDGLLAAPAANAAPTPPTPAATSVK